MATANSTTPVQLPSGEQTVTVKLINPVNFGPAILKRFMAPDVPGLDKFKDSPSFSFLLEHPSGRKLVFDLGIRKDYVNHAPKIADYLPSTGYTIDVTKNVADILEEGGVPLAEVEAVIWRFVDPLFRGSLVPVILDWSRWWKELLLISIING